MPTEKYTVTPQNDPDQSLYTCKGIRTARPTYSVESSPFKTKNLCKLNKNFIDGDSRHPLFHSLSLFLCFVLLVLKRRILLSVSGCLFFGIILAFLGCIYFKIRKPGVTSVWRFESLFSVMCECFAFILDFFINLFRLVFSCPTVVAEERPEENELFLTMKKQLEHTGGFTLQPCGFGCLSEHSCHAAQ